MPDPKAVQIMKSLNKEEMKEFGRFVESPYFNRLSDVVRLYNILKKYHPEFKAEDIDNEKIFRKLFPSKSYNDARMRNLISDLGQLSEKYLMNKSWEENRTFKNYVYQHHLKSRKLYEIFEKSVKAVEKDFEKDDTLEIDLKKYFQGMLKYDYYLETNQQHKSSESAYQKFDSLVEFFLPNMVRGLYDFKVHKNMHAYEKEASLLKFFSDSFDFDKFIKTIDSENSESVLLRIVYYLFKLLQGEQLEMNFDLLLKLMEEHEKEFTHQFKYDVYLNLRNLLAFKTYEDGLDYNPLRLILVKEVISKKLYNYVKKNLIIPLLLFVNGVNLSVQLNDLVYAEYLLDNYLNLLPSKSRKSAHLYTMAQLEFVNGNFQKSLEYLSNIDYEIVQLRKHVKNLTLLLYYELNYIDSAESLAISYRQYLNRNNGFIGMYGEWYDNFLKFYSILITINRDDHKELEQLRRRIDKTVKVLFKSWLLEKLDL